jgi:hypothetical protein
VIKTRRFLVGAAAAAVCALVASGCDTSPVAVSVNSQQIKQTAINADLRAYAENPAFVKAYDSQTSSSGGASPTVAGVAKGTYSSSFVAGVVNSEVETTALHQYLAAHNNLPSAELVADARAWQSYLDSPYWLGFSASFRAQLAQETAEESQFTPVSTKTSALQGAAKQAEAYLYSYACVRQVAFSVNDADGNVDYAASLAAAHKALAASPTLSGGALTCYTPVKLEGQGQSFYNTVLHLKVGTATAPQKTAFGYQVVELFSRTPLPLDADMKRVISLIAAEENGSSATKLEQNILTSAKVHLNPQYGTWDPQHGVTPVTLPPSVSTAAAAGS